MSITNTFLEALKAPISKVAWGSYVGSQQDASNVTFGLTFNLGFQPDLLFVGAHWDVQASDYYADTGYRQVITAFSFTCSQAGIIDGANNHVYSSTKSTHRDYFDTSCSYPQINSTGFVITTGKNYHDIWTTKSSSGYDYGGFNTQDCTYYYLAIKF